MMPFLLRHENMWSSYDKEADVLYLHFKRPAHADRSEMTDDDIIVRYENDEVVGMTVLNASKRFSFQNSPS
jgi:uncharacterized protein YuzE